VAKARPTYSIDSVDSALTILRMLCATRTLRVSEVAAGIDVAPSTAQRLLSMLVHHGFVKQDERSGEYVMGPMFLEMGFAAVWSLEVRQHARPILEELNLHTNETIALSVPYGHGIVFSARDSSSSNWNSGNDEVSASNDKQRP
jgi:IclR family transcriptional regulator, acetate operon repressor